MRLSERREALGLTQKQVAAYVGADQSQISCYESGLYRPKYPVAKKMAELYSCTVDEIMEPDERRPTCPEKNQSTATTWKT